MIPSRELREAMINLAVSMASSNSSNCGYVTSILSVVLKAVHMNSSTIDKS